METTPRERAPRRDPAHSLSTPVLLTLALVLGAGCSQAPAPASPAEVAEAPAASEPVTPDAAAAPPAEEAPEPEAQPTEVTAQPTEVTAEPAEVTAPPAEAAPAPAEPDHTVIVIERGDREREAKPRTLYEASVAARAERAKAAPSTVTVTDENLHEFQGKGLTFAETPDGEEGEASEEAEAAAAASTGQTAGEAAGGPARGESYWRSRVRDLRLGLRQAVDELVELEERAASLRRSFYAEDDPYVRDVEIKPAWDRALDRIAETRRALFRLREELGDTLEEGRRAGALPGWLREGIDLEPRPEELPRPPDGAHEPGEPRVMEIGEEPP